MKRLLTFILTWLQAAGLCAAMEPFELRCEYQRMPLAIDELQPRLSWLIRASERNVIQSAYEIRLSTTPEGLRGRGLWWQSGKVASPRQNQIPYKGKPLESFTRYYWQVRVFDEKGKPSAWSQPTWFETAMLSQNDWKAAWIGDGRPQFERDEDFYQDDPMPLFRKTFTVQNEVARARLYISGLGYYEAYLNGRKVSDHHLDPGWTAYGKEVLYAAHDVTDLITSGQQVLGVMLGNGWYNPLPLRLFSRFNLRDVQETGRPRVRAELHLFYRNGAHEAILTDTSWQTAPGPVIRNNVYLGERYDARLERADWQTPVLRDAGAWKPAVVVAAPSGRLRAQQQPPIQVTKVITPVSVHQRQPGVHMVDMGQNFAGVVRIRVQGPRGTVVKFKYGEALHPDGSLNYLTTVAGQIKEIWNLKGGPGAPPTAWQEDQYTLKGEGEEVWYPLFTFHGFRYVEVTNWPGELKPTHIEGLRLQSAIAPVGNFACSDEWLNRLHEVNQWTFLSNVFSVQSDCPGREKMGYGADMVVTANSYLYNYDMAQFYTKAVRDFRNDQQPDGGITEMAPFTGIADRGYGGYSGPLGWQLAFPYLQHQLYQFYGDQRLIEESYPALQQQLAFLKSKAVDGLFHWDISDHEAIDPRPEAFSAGAFYYHHVQLAQTFARLLGNSAHEQEYEKWAAQIKQRLVRKYLVPGTGRFDNATQSAQAFALWYELSPEADQSFEVLKQELQRHDYHVSSGIFGVWMLWDVLRARFEADLAYQVISRPGYPGWKYMLEEGATTLWETWKYPDNAPSQNHPMFGSTEEWFFGTVLGIEPAAPAFSKIRLRPQPVRGLSWAKGSYQSPYGLIRSEWKLEGPQYRLLVEVPPNTTAEVWIRAQEGAAVTEQGKPVTGVVYRHGFAVVNVGSGTYAFSTAWHPGL
ncbi:MAG: family 78 glycoside hydrolase catalytic domain [Bacteroidota bacterium]